MGTVVITKDTRFTADASKLAGGTPHTFLVAPDDAERWLFRLDDATEYERWCKDIGRLKMTFGGLPTTSSRFGSFFQKASTKSGAGSTSVLNATTFQTPPRSPALSGPASSTAAGGSNPARDFSAKLADILRLEEQIARKRSELMAMLAAAESTGGLELSDGLPNARTQAAAALGTLTRPEAYRQRLMQDCHKRLVAMSEWSGAAGELSFVPGDEIHAWYSAIGTGWAYGSGEGRFDQLCASMCPLLIRSCAAKDGLAGWFPLVATAPLKKSSSSALTSVPVESKKLDLQGFAVKVFNMSASKGVKWMQAQLLKLRGPDEAGTFHDLIGAFLWDHRAELSKEQLGDCFGDDDGAPGHLSVWFRDFSSPFPAEDCQAIYRAFVSRFNVVGLDLDLAMRRLMYMFRLPGEAQKVDRVVRVFAEHYHKSNCGSDSKLPLVRDGLKTWREAYTLVFALIMLNTDAHTENLPNRMSCQQFLDNIRYSTKEGIFIDNDYLSDMYWRIVNEELKKEENAKFPFASKKVPDSRPSLSCLWSLISSPKGYLELKMGPFWAKRWVILNEGKLIVCKSSTHEDDYQLLVPLSTTLVSTELLGGTEGPGAAAVSSSASSSSSSSSKGSSGNPFGITISTPVSKLRFRCKTERERQQWLVALDAERDNTIDDDSLMTPRDELPPVRLETADLFTPRSAPAPSPGVPRLPDVVSSPAASRPARSPRRSPRPGGSGGKKKRGPAKKTRKTRTKVVALYDVTTPPDPQCVTVAAGEVLLLVQRTNELWSKVQTHSGVVGYIPASYVMTHVSGISSLEPPPQPDLPKLDFSVRPLPVGDDVADPLGTSNSTVPPAGGSPSPIGLPPSSLLADAELPTTPMRPNSLSMRASTKDSDSDSDDVFVA